MRTPPTQQVIKLTDLNNQKLTIPTYQRPYKWTKKNVIQLLEDIFEYVILKNKDYRIGNIILHKEDAINNIVDGQQRLTTITLLLKILDSSFEGLLLNEKYTHNISKNNIVYNYRIINKWINTKFKNKNEEKDDFKKQILDKCEFVVFTVFQQDEAFQLFDSQNARGKALEPYDLLKAFHLREMDFDSEEDRTKCVERWETSVDNGTLKPILDNHLFKIRKWSKNEWKYNFTNEDIEEFKGISLHQKQQYPYESAMRILDGCVENAHNDKLLRNFQIAQTFPFQITNPIINGKKFFEYVDFYIRQREKLFDLNKEDSRKAEMQEFVEFYKKYCCDYKGSGRSGDEKVRNLYENILMAFVDKFGYIDDFENFYKAFYKLAYIIRCENKRISVATIMKSSARQIFTKINNAVHPDVLKHYQYKTYEIDKKNLVQGIKEIADFIIDEFDFRKALEKGLNMAIEEDDEHFLVPFQFMNHILYIHIGYKENLYWYGISKNKYDKLGEEEVKALEEKLKELKFEQNDNDWFGWNKFELHDTTKIIDDIKKWLSVFSKKVEENEK